MIIASRRKIRRETANPLSTFLPDSMVVETTYLNAAVVDRPRIVLREEQWNGDCLCVLKRSTFRIFSSGNDKRVGGDS